MPTERSLQKRAEGVGGRGTDELSGGNWSVRVTELGCRGKAMALSIGTGPLEVEGDFVSERDAEHVTGGPSLRPQDDV